MNSAAVPPEQSVPDPSGARRRPYDASSRRAAARAHRAAVLDASRELFLRDGYRATTIKAVARAAGVSPETVYKGFGNKAALLKALWDVTQAGDDEPLTMAERPLLRGVLDARADLGEKLWRYAGFVADTHERLADLILLLEQAGPDASGIVAETEAERLRGVTAFLGHLADQGLLGPEPEPAPGHAADAGWALAGPLLYVRLTRERGWSADTYRRWLRDMLSAAWGPKGVAGPAGE